MYLVETDAGEVSWKLQETVDKDLYKRFKQTQNEKKIKRISIDEMRQLKKDLKQRVVKVKECGSSLRIIKAIYFKDFSKIRERFVLVEEKNSSKRWCCFNSINSSELTDFNELQFEIYKVESKQYFRLKHEIKDKDKFVKAVLKKGVGVKHSEPVNNNRIAFCESSRRSVHNQDVIELESDMTSIDLPANPRNMLIEHLYAWIKVESDQHHLLLVKSGDSFSWLRQNDTDHEIWMVLLDMALKMYGEPFVCSIQEFRAHFKKFNEFQRTVIALRTDKTFLEMINRTSCSPNLNFVTTNPPKQFVFIHFNHYSKEIKVTSPASSCQCKDECAGMCPCMYWHRYNEEGQLIFTQDRIIRECNSMCSCSERCPNRVVQQGRQTSVTVFETDGRGLGLKTNTQIEKGEFVEEYVGEVISSNEADERANHEYLFDLDIEVAHRKRASFCIDALYLGNAARFINHACDPNLLIVAVLVECQDVRLHRIAMFARRTIFAGEELTFDYSGISYKEEKVRRTRKRSSNCKCGGTNCRGFILA